MKKHDKKVFLKFTNKNEYMELSHKNRHRASSCSEIKNMLI